MGDCTVRYLLFRALGPFIVCDLGAREACAVIVLWHSECQEQGMRQLRERGIYLAPTGESFVASRERTTVSDGKRILSQLGSRLSCFLFGRYEWAFHGTPAYEVDTSGTLVAIKQLSDFRLEQLVDTGATAGAH